MKHATNVISLPGHGPSAKPNAAPNEDLIQMLESALSLAQSGTLQSLIATGWTRDGLHYQLMADYHTDIFQMLGALEWTKQEYIRTNQNDEDA